MKITLTGTQSYALSGQTIDKLIRHGDGDAALLYLYILRANEKSIDEMAAAKALDKSKGWMASAMAALSRIGLIDIIQDALPTGNSVESSVSSSVSRRTAIHPIREQRNYTDDEIKAELASGSDFVIVVEETQRRLGKILSPDDLLRLYGIYDSLKLPPDVILQLITHCINECRYGDDGRSPSLHYIEKAAYTWEREGIFSIERAEQYLRALEEKKTVRSKIKHALMIRDREFSETEKHYVDEWIKMGFTPEAVTLAHDKTVVNTGKLTWPYIDTILKRWDRKGLHTAQQVIDAENNGKSKGTPNRYPKPGGRQGSFKHDEPNREEIERLNKILDNINE